MRQLLLAVWAISALMLSARAAKGQSFKTNSVDLGEHGTLQMLTPTDWSLVHTNSGMPGAPSIELQSPGNTTKIRITIYWDGFGGKITHPTPTDFEDIVSNVAVRQYVPISVEKTVALERLKGPAVSGTFARFTDATWVPMLKGDYRAAATGMFRCENLWGYFDVVTGDKDGPMFKQSLQVLESMRRKT